MMGSGNYYSVGLHPWLLESSPDISDLMLKVEQKAGLKNILAVGECGLDKMIRIDMTIQEKVFTDHVAIAEKVSKPLIIHCVKTFNELMQLKRKLHNTTPWILHGFKGSPELAEQLLLQGFLFSFGKALLNSESKALRSLPYIPDDCIFFETDESDLNISDLYSAASVYKNCPVEELDSRIQSNFNRIFPVG
jgi:TatD DNase family protein